MEKDIAEKYNAFTTGNSNIVWVGTMALCWKELASFSKVEKLEFHTKDPNALKTISNLNNSPFKRKDIS